MTKKIIICLISTFFLFSNYIFSECKCYQRELHKIERIIYFNNQKICNFEKELSDFQLFLERERFQLHEWQSCLSSFESYLSSLQKPNKIITVKYRFLRWLNITYKNLIGFKRSLIRQLKQITCDFNLKDFNYCINELQSYNYPFPTCDTHQELYVGLNTSIQSTHTTIDSFNNVTQEANRLIDETIEFRSMIKNLLCSERFENCCCWY